ncbi:TonB-dependent Receptor Plug Domain [Algoriphagus ornithinivorans]|uniref:TonB-dependent Receptor Plug Domain n=1 Tax=Algoriphagus ornithinivorans TaxID=226506 RepID=A0A1I5EVZ3_9BACT|nr:carboxypeptidase-like regulatory domain-containing protein [Algoriphagus ornithinivorans]SFO15583.1 TonB-dependent Receptor Plug Domain [Algoriphagus ornithinivorans]
MKAGKPLILFLLLILNASLTYSQTGSIKGIVKDADTGETLPFCNVFINNTTISTVTDMDGAYLLENLEPGALELSFSFLGYQAETKKVGLNPGGILTVNLSMRALETELSDVEIKAKRDKNWERDLRKFQNLFLGNDAIASQAIIENPWVVDFPEVADKNSFQASTQLPLEINNNYLGYKITFDLKEFFNTPTNYKIAGAARFEEMKPESETQRKTWEQNRADVYRKSPQNMFRAIINGEQEREGFFLYGDKPGGSPSLNMRSDIFANELGRSVIPYKTDQMVVPADKPGEYWINLKGRIEIHYQKGYTQINTYKDAPYPVSWLEVNGGKVRVRENGSILNPQDLVFSGDMDRKRIATILPLDYDAEKAIQLQNLERTASNFQEKVYLHTDKPYYYAGDEVFFKAYFKYGNPYLKEELSKVLHVELLNSTRDFVIEKKFKIFDGVVVGNFYLPDSLSEEKYFLRAYTNWNKNYGPDHYFIKTLPVLGPFERLNAKGELTLGSEYVQVNTPKNSYGPREKVSLTLTLTDKNQKPIQANLSVSVLDQSLVSPMEDPAKIKQTLVLDEIPESIKIDRFSYPVEKSLSQKGKVLDEKGKGVQSQVTVFINDFEGIVDLESDRNGDFSLEEMEFYGPMKIAIQAQDKKGKNISNIQLEPELNAPVSLPKNSIFPPIEKSDTPIREITLREREQELEPVLVEDKKATKTEAIYGNADYVVSGDKIMATGNSVDLVNSLAGNVPGMRVTLEGASGRQQIRLRGGATSVSSSMEPLVMINGAIMASTGSSTAADNLRSINPNDIDRIEVVSRTVSMLGDQGRNGVIAVYLKEGNQNISSPLMPSVGLSQFVIEGYEPVKSFFYMDYEQEKDFSGKDQRQTLYWNPYLVTDESGKVSISFYTNDLAGPMTVEVRGLGINGEPVSGTFIINPK